MDAERLERAARAAATLAYDMGNEDGRNPAKGLGATLDAAVVRTMHIDRAVAAALAAQPAQAGGGDACCLFCRTELDPDEMDDGSDLPPLAPGVCSECFQRWHDEPVWRKRLKEATDKPAQEGEAVLPFAMFCYVCGEPAACIGYECGEGPGAHTLNGCCNDHCGHGNESERCVRLAPNPSRPGGAAQEQAGEAVAWGVRRVRTGIIVAAEITKDAAVERASDLTRTLQEEFSTDGHGIPLYAAPSRPGGASQEQAGEAVAWHRVQDGDTVIAGGRKITMRVEPFRADPHPSRPGGA